MSTSFFDYFTIFNPISLIFRIDSTLLLTSSIGFLVELYKQLDIYYKITKTKIYYYE